MLEHIVFLCELLVAEMNVSRRILVLNTFIFIYFFISILDGGSTI